MEGVTHGTQLHRRKRARLGVSVDVSNPQHDDLNEICCPQARCCRTLSRSIGGCLESTTCKGEHVERSRIHSHELRHQAFPVRQGTRCQPLSRLSGLQKFQPTVTRLLCQRSPATHTRLRSKRVLNPDDANFVQHDVPRRPSRLRWQGYYGLCLWRGTASPFGRDPCRYGFAATRDVISSGGGSTPGPDLLQPRQVPHGWLFCTRRQSRVQGT